MKATVLRTDEPDKVIELTPRCSRDFCDRCGDCLHCYGGDPCLRFKTHVWVIYEDEELPETD